jgi:hypothetical protein
MRGRSSNFIDGDAVDEYYEFRTRLKMVHVCCSCAQKYHHSVKQYQQFL